VIGAVTWHGRRGSVLLGPTEARVARYLEHATRHGRISLRTRDLVVAIQLERSEAYRITRRLRELGLFGIENDRGGTKGGRRYWRTPLEHDGQMLDRDRHRTAWSRIVGWARTRRDLLHARLAELRAAPFLRFAGVLDDTAGATPRAGPVSPRTARGGTFAESMRRHGLGPLMDEWARSNTNRRSGPFWP
jgi:hypothetical protein